MFAIISLPASKAADGKVGDGGACVLVQWRQTTNLPWRLGRLGSMDMATVCIDEHQTAFLIFVLRTWFAFKDFEIKVETTILSSNLFPQPIRTSIVNIMNIHSQHHEHPKLAVFITNIQS
jgi:hypothetical protein